MPFPIPPASIAYFNGYNGADTIAINTSDAVAIAADAAGNPKGYSGAFIQVITAGNIVVVDISGNQRTYTAAPANFVIPFFVKQVRATGTTAVSIGLIPRY